MRVCRAEVAEADLHDAIVDTRLLPVIMQGIRERCGRAWALPQLMADARFCVPFGVLKEKRKAQWIKKGVISEDADMQSDSPPRSKQSQPVASSPRSSAAATQQQARTPALAATST